MSDDRSNFEQILSHTYLKTVWDVVLKLLPVIDSSIKVDCFNF